MSSNDLNSHMRYVMYLCDVSYRVTCIIFNQCFNFAIIRPAGTLSLFRIKIYVYEPCKPFKEKYYYLRHHLHERHLFYCFYRVFLLNDEDGSSFPSFLLLIQKHQKFAIDTRIVWIENVTFQKMYICPKFQSHMKWNNVFKCFLL